MTYYIYLLTISFKIKLNVFKHLFYLLLSIYSWQIVRWMFC